MDDTVSEGSTATRMRAKHPLQDQVMLLDMKVGSLIGVESHMYDNFPALFTAKSDEKTKLL